MGDEHLDNLVRAGGLKSEAATEVDESLVEALIRATEEVAVRLQDMLAGSMPDAE